jgi:hypothetical protein
MPQSIQSNWSDRLVAYFLTRLYQITKVASKCNFVCIQLIKKFWGSDAHSYADISSWRDCKDFQVQDAMWSRNIIEVLDAVLNQVCNTHHTEPVSYSTLCLHPVIKQNRIHLHKFSQKTHLKYFKVNVLDIQIFPSAVYHVKRVHLHNSICCLEFWEKTQFCRYTGSCTK